MIKTDLEIAINQVKKFMKKRGKTTTEKLHNFITLPYEPVLNDLD